MINDWVDEVSLCFYLYFFVIGLLKNDFWLIDFFFSFLLVWIWEDEKQKDVDEDDSGIKEGGDEVGNEAEG